MLVAEMNTMEETQDLFFTVVAPYCGLAVILLQK